MKVIHTSIAQAITINLNGELTPTGIYKKPIEAGIVLASKDVVDDAVMDRKYHGGVFKACYLYGQNNYAQFKLAFPKSPWQPAMFGENITLSELDETQLMIGDVYQLGAAKIQITEPRMPCSKLAHKFENKEVLKAFTQSANCGVYVKVLEEGRVKPKDTMVLVKKNNSEISIADVYAVMGNQTKNKALIDCILASPFVTKGNKESILKKL